MLTLEETVAFARPVGGPREDLPERTEVLIVGAGPVGLAALDMLTTLGISCALIERNATTSALPKAIAIDDEFTRLLSNLGLEDEVLAAASHPFGIHFKSRTNGDLITVNAFQTVNGFGNRVAISQPVLEKTLLSRREPSASAVRYGTSVTGLRQGDDGVEVDLEDESGGCGLIRAQYLLACDGARSTVREMTGIAFPGRRIDEPHLVIDLAEFPDQTPASRFFCNPRRPLNSIPGPFGGRRLEFMLNPDDDRERLLTDEGIRWLVDEFSPYRGVPLKVIRRAIYGFSARIAERFQVGRVFFLGDAAHVMPPFGGQGLNTGARDVANLGWKLSLVLRGQASPRILQSYDGERRGQVMRIVKYSVAVGTLTNIRSRWISSLRDAFIRAINLIPPVRDYLSSMKYMPRPAIDEGLLIGETGDSSNPVGKVFPRLVVRDHAGSVAPIDAWIKFRHGLLLFDADTAELKKAADAAARISAPMFVANVVGPSRPVADEHTVQCANDLSESWAASHSGRCVLLRPDRYVAGQDAIVNSEKLLGLYAKLLWPTD